MKTYKCLILCIMAASVAMYGCSSDDEPQNEQAHSRMNMTQEQSLISTAETDLAFGLFECMYADAESNENVLFSPLSKDLCYALVTNAIYEKDRTSILNAYNASSVDVLNDFNNARLDYFSYNSLNSKVLFANSLWANSLTMTNRDEFASMCEMQKRYYDAETRIMHFGKDNVRSAINDWCSSKTHGLISEYLKDDPTENSQCIFLNAMYFKCAWKHTFKKSKTAMETFYSADGKQVITKTPMMTDNREVAVTESSNISAFMMPYSSCNYSAVFILPHEGKTIKDILPEAKRMLATRLLDETNTVMCTIGIPRFSSENSKDITTYVESTGINISGKEMFGFGRIANTRTKQAVALSVDENGTEAAAITSTDMDTSVGKQIEIILNRPFLMIVKDDNHGSILLMAAIQMPKE